MAFTEALIMVVGNGLNVLHIHVHVILITINNAITESQSTVKKIMVIL